MAAITAESVKNLREATGAGMMDCKKALNETGGDFEKAVAWLRERGIAKAAKRSGRVAAEGAIASYIHHNRKVGVLIEVNCETDFVARGDDFQKTVQDICMHIASTAPLCIERSEVPQDAMQKEMEIYVAQAKETGKPEHIATKIAEGKLSKWYSEVCLMEQPFVMDSGKTIEQLLTELSAKTGEKITVRRFSRFQLGEGIEKKESNLAEEVAAELAKAEQKG